MARWRVYPDDISLTLLLDVLKFARDADTLSSRFGRLTGQNQSWLDRGRLLFREIILTNWPWLSKTASPLRRSRFRDLFRAADATPLVPVSPAYTHIVPSDLSFQSYISMLGYCNRADEIPVALAWMKELSIRPTWKCMGLALMHTAEIEGPQTMASGSRGTTVRTGRRALAVLVGGLAWLFGRGE